MRRSCAVLLLFLTVVDRRLASALVTLGNPCYMPNGMKGYCELLKDCEPVYKNVQIGIQPEVVCEVVGLKYVVCCPRSNVSGNRQPRTTQPPKPVNVRNDTGITNVTDFVFPKISRAEKMCLKYSKGKVLPVEIDVRITNGTQSEPLEFPHMAALGCEMDRSIAWICGGTLISNNYVLTAAHCAANFQCDNKHAELVRLGTVNLYKMDEWVQERRIIRRIYFPLYNKPAKYHDIALLEMDRPVTFNDHIRPACLSLDPTIWPNDMPIATGWGSISFMGESHPSLLKVSLPIVAYEICNRSYMVDNVLPHGIDSKTQFCAGGKNGKDTCTGDSGGPLVLKSKVKNMYDIIGITSFGKMCGSRVPGVYTKVNYYLDWIESIVWP